MSVNFDEVAEKRRTRKEGTPQRTGVALANMSPRINCAYIVKGLIGPNTLVAVIGASGSGKTFFSTDLAMHIAASKPWRGKPVRGGLVIYAALEGAMSAENRFCAARDKGDFPAGVPLCMTPEPINLRKAEDVLELATFAKRMAGEHGVDPAAIFIDTVNRAIAGGDENSSEDMGALVKGADTLRDATGAAVILVHHTGKDEGRGARGHSSLKAALDTEIEVSDGEQGHIATITKQRDLPIGDRLGFTLEVVELGVDEEGDPVTTCIVKHGDAPVPPPRKPIKGKNQEKLVAALDEWRRQNGDTQHISTIELRKVAEGQKLDRRRCFELTQSLVTYGYLTPSVGGFTMGKASEMSESPNTSGQFGRTSGRPKASDPDNSDGQSVRPKRPDVLGESDNSDARGTA